MQKAFTAQLKRMSVTILAFATLLAFSGFVRAQNVRSSVDRHTHPEGGFFETQRSSRGISHARDYARDIYQYSTGVQVVTPQVMKSESQWLGQNIVGAQQHVAVLQEQFKGSPNKLESVKTISQHLTKAAELQKELHTECCKQTVDGMVCSKCCSNIVKELDKAAVEHEALVREVEMDAHHGGDHPQPSKPK